VVNAYLLPAMRQCLRRLSDRLSAVGIYAPAQVVASNGGMTGVACRPNNHDSGESLDTILAMISDQKASITSIISKLLGWRDILDLTQSASPT
jgi:hypothetical protein